MEETSQSVVRRSQQYFTTAVDIGSEWHEAQTWGVAVSDGQDIAEMALIK